MRPRICREWNARETPVVRSVQKQNKDTKIHTMRAVKGERLQQFVERRLPYKGKRISSQEMTKGKKGESSPYSYSS